MPAPAAYTPFGRPCVLRGRLVFSVEYSQSIVNISIHMIKESLFKSSKADGIGGGLPSGKDLRVHEVAASGAKLPASHLMHSLPAERSKSANPAAHGVHEVVPALA